MALSECGKTEQSSQREGGLGPGWGVGGTRGRHHKWVNKTQVADVKTNTHKVPLHPHGAFKNTHMVPLHPHGALTPTWCL